MQSLSRIMFVLTQAQYLLVLFAVCLAAKSQIRVFVDLVHITSSYIQDILGLSL